eukprot:5927595-Prymnesium_polylepis.1
MSSRAWTATPVGGMRVRLRSVTSRNLSFASSLDTSLSSSADPHVFFSTVTALPPSLLVSAVLSRRGDDTRASCDGAPRHRLDAGAERSALIRPLGPAAIRLKKEMKQEVGFVKMKFDHVIIA